jgi:hypothetical protein
LKATGVFSAAWQSPKIRKLLMGDCFSPLGLRNDIPPRNRILGNYYGSI